MFTNLQLFGDGEAVENATPEVVETQPVEEKVKTVSKELFDKTSSELAAMKKQMKELENKGKTNEQITADAIAEKEQLLKDYDLKLREASIKLNKANAMSIVSEAKVKIALDSKNTDFESLLNCIVSDDEDKTAKNADCFNKLVLAIYEKGFNDSKKSEWSSMTNGIKSTNDGKEFSVGAKYAQQVSSKNKEEKIAWGINKN